jgi:hypothetical protein
MYFLPPFYGTILWKLEQKCPWFGAITGNIAGRNNNKKNTFIRNYLMDQIFSFNVLELCKNGKT